MGTDQIIPTGFEVSKHENGETIKLAFSDDKSHSYEVLLGRTNLPLLISELQKLAPSPRVQMRPEDISLGDELALRGVKVAQGHDGGVRLTLSVQMDEKHGIDLPINLTKSDRDGLVSQLMAFDQRS